MCAYVVLVSVELAARSISQLAAVGCCVAHESINQKLELSTTLRTAQQVRPVTVKSTQSGVPLSGAPLSIVGFASTCNARCMHDRIMSSRR